MRPIVSSPLIPLAADSCDEPEEDCSEGYPEVCNSGCAAVLLPFRDACLPLFNSEAVGMELLGIARIIELAAASCPMLPGGDPGAAALVAPPPPMDTADGCGGQAPADPAAAAAFVQACLEAGCGYDEVEGCFSQGKPTKAGH